MAFLFGSSNTPQLSLVEQIGNSTLQYRNTRTALVNRVITAAFTYATQQLQAFSTSHVENTYTFDFGTSARNVTGWETLSIAERNQVATGVANLFAAQNITANATNEANVERAVSATLVLSWAVPAAIIVPTPAATAVVAVATNAISNN